MKLGSKGKKFSVGGLERGSSGALGDWDVIGKSLDKANPFASTDDGRDEQAKAAALEEAASHGFDNLTPPSSYTQEHWLGDYKPTAQVNAGDPTQYKDIDARLADVSSINGNAYDDVSTDPRLKDAQMASLSSLDDIISHGGRTAAEEAQLNRSLSDVATQDRGRREAILQHAQQTGGAGGGMELLAQLQSSQAAADRANQSGLDINADAEQRGLEAIMNRGNLAGSVRGQDYGEQAQRAQAANAIAQFNANAANQGSQFNAGQANNMGQFNASNQLQNAQYNKNMAYDANKTNVGYANDASKTNWAGKQQMANDATAAYNNFQQQNFQNQMGVAGAKTGAQKGYADYVGGVGNTKTAANAAQKGAVLGTFGSIMGGAMAGRQAKQPKQPNEPDDQEQDDDDDTTSDERAKTSVRNVSPNEIDEFLTALSPKHFRYRDSKDGPGDRVGVMAQEIEGTSLGKDIVHDDGVKKLDNKNLLGAIVASLAHLHKKVGK